MENLIHLDDFSLETIIETLKTRYNRDHIYTSIGHILVAINPFKVLKIYTHDVLRRYADCDPIADGVSPHIFRSAALMFRQLADDRVGQALVISGDSGAGKSESTKLILEYLSVVAAPRDVSSCSVMDTTPILEAFGNAKTVKNNNSSRFGKWIQVFLSQRDSAICGTTIVNFLLEKTRVVFQAAGERNYHIFYQFCAGASAKVKAELEITAASNYQFLNKGDAMTIAGMDDSQDWAATLTALDKLRFSPSDVASLQRMLAIIMHLGNLRLEANSKDQAEVRNLELLSLIGKLMRVSNGALEQALLNRSLTVHGQTSIIPLSAVQALQARDALAKGLYGSMFDWAIKNIQKVLAPPEKEKGCGTIGVLDIFGFEIFQTNSLEQLFINYANEKLQQLFNMYVFKMEQNECHEEGVKLPGIEFVDNLVCCALIDGKGGIFRMLEEEGLIPQGQDAHLLSKMTKSHNKHVNFEAPKTRKDVFVIKHYAGDVVYDIVGFVEKNKDKMGNEVAHMACSSGDTFIRALFSSIDQTPTLSKGFQASLSHLNAILEASQLHFVRCFKPNNDKKPHSFLDALIKEQIQCAGLIQAIRIRKAGFPFRKTFKLFLFHFRCLLPNGGIKGDLKTQCEGLRKHLSNKYPTHASVLAEMQLGKTKVFWRTSHEVILSKLRIDALTSMVVKLQRFLLVIRAKQQLKIRRKVCKACTAVLKSRDQAAAKEALQLAEINSVKLPIVQQVRELLNVKKQCEDMIGRLQAATGGDSLRLLILEARQFLFDYPNPSLKAAIESAEALYNKQTKKQQQPSSSSSSTTTAASSAVFDESKEKKSSFSPSPPLSSSCNSSSPPSSSSREGKGVSGGSGGVAELMERARNTRGQYPLTVYCRLRTRESYIKGFHLNKESHYLRMLMWQNFPIMRSLTVPDAQEKLLHPMRRVKSARACSDIFKNLLGFMGDSRTVYPDPLGFKILQWGFQYPVLRDEIYCQIMKQTTRNPSFKRKTVRGCVMGWKLLYLCLCYFRPSLELSVVILDHCTLCLSSSGGNSGGGKNLLECKFDNEEDIATMCFYVFFSSIPTKLPSLEEFSSWVQLAGTGDQVEALVFKGRILPPSQRRGSLKSVNPELVYGNSDTTVRVSASSPEEHKASGGGSAFSRAKATVERKGESLLSLSRNFLSNKAGGSPPSPRVTERTQRSPSPSPPLSAPLISPSSQSHSMRAPLPPRPPPSQTEDDISLSPPTSPSSQSHSMRAPLPLRAPSSAANYEEPSPPPLSPRGPPLRSASPTAPSSYDDSVSPGRFVPSMPRSPSVLSQDDSALPSRLSPPARPPDFSSPNSSQSLSPRGPPPRSKSPNR